MKSGQNNNGYVPYVDYARDYSPPPHSLATLRATNNHNSNGLMNITPTTNMNGQIPSGNLSLNRNRTTEILMQDNGLPSIQSSMNSLQNGLLGMFFCLDFIFKIKFYLFVFFFVCSTTFITKWFKHRSTLQCNIW